LLPPSISTTAMEEDAQRRTRTRWEECLLIMMNTPHVLSMVESSFTRCNSVGIEASEGQETGEKQNTPLSCVHLLMSISFSFSRL
ncbi:hypothetical protein PENTCL1PPCAC_19978, partial [Pristionchus entomophagus]